MKFFILLIVACILKLNLTESTMRDLKLNDRTTEDLTFYIRYDYPKSELQTIVNAKVEQKSRFKWCI